MANLVDVVTQDKWITEEARKLADYLVSSGIIQDLDVKNDQVREIIRRKNELAYHNTELLLKRYRDFAWQMSYAPFEIASELDHSCENIQEVIRAFDYEFVTHNKSMEYRLERLENSVLMFKTLNEAITVMRKRPKIGELLYKIIYYTYIDPEERSINDILQILMIKRSYYYDMKKEAISTITTRMWYGLPGRQVGMLIEAAKSCT